MVFLRSLLCNLKKFGLKTFIFLKDYYIDQMILNIVIFTNELYNIFVSQKIKNIF